MIDKSYTGKSLQEMKDRLKAAMETKKEKEAAARFIEASGHPYACTCEMCKEWWDVMGPEEQ